MDVSYNWLKELTGLNWPVDEAAHRLTLCGTACEYVEPTARFMKNVVVGEVTKLGPVEGATKIKLATVDLGDRQMDVICGAPNVDVGQKVPVALEGAELAGGMVIKKVKIRGIESSAMICSERELGISDDHSGIMVLESSAVNGTPLARHLDYEDYILTFEITPNRGDSMSAIGIARDLAALASVTVKKPGFELKESTEKASDVVKVSIEDKEGCPRYAARVIRKVKIGPSPWWLKKKLLMSGVRPISNVVDITNLVMLETGHPLHAFDLDRFGSSEVVVRKAADKEKFATLDGKAHELTPDVLLITNGKAGVAAGGVMGGLDSEVEESTTNILLEAAYFNPAVIRRGRKHLGLATESSSRFERGTDPNGIPFAIDRAAFLFAELCGGEVLEGIVDCYPDKIEPKRVSLRPSRCNDLMGITIPTERMKQILTDLEFEVSGDDPLEVVVPTFRPDIEREVDLIEEVVRIEGYDNIPDAITNIGPLYTPQSFEDRFRIELRQLMVSSGFDELVNHGLVDGRLATILDPDLPQVKIVNPVSEDLNIMRNELVQSTLNVIRHNVAHRCLDLRLFEIGKIYLPGTNETDWIEQNRLAVAVSGHTEHSWRQQPRPLDFYDITGPLGNLASHFGWDEFEYVPRPISYFEDEVSFDIVCSKTVVGQVGQIAKPVLSKFDLKQIVFLAELNLQPLRSISGSLKRFKPLPIYPAAPRDLAMIVEENVKAGDLVRAVMDVGGELAESVEIFDLYTGKQIEKGKKSIAISINYRSREGNLESVQVDAVQKAVIDKLIKKFKVQIRDR